MIFNKIKINIFKTLLFKCYIQNNIYIYIYKCYLTKTSCSFKFKNTYDVILMLIFNIYILFTTFNNTKLFCIEELLFNIHNNTIIFIV